MYLKLPPQYLAESKCSKFAICYHYLQSYCNDQIAWKNVIPFGMNINPQMFQKILCWSLKLKQKQKQKELSAH